MPDDHMATRSFGMKNAVMITAGLIALFAIAAVLVVAFGATQSVSRLIYHAIDLPGFVVFALVMILCLALALPMGPARRIAVIDLAKLSPTFIAFAVLLISVVGVQVIYQGYGFSMDEWMTQLQAEIFASGRISGIVPEEWRPYGKAMYHGFASFDPQTGTVASNYRPGMAMIYAAFSMVGLGAYTSAILNAAAILLVARVARQLFPDHIEAPVIAALLLATSQQALAASLTPYAMSAHLCLNLLWLTLFLENRWLTHVVAAVIGVATASLHQIHAHLFFALPFLLTLLAPIQWRVLAIYAVIYAVGHAAVSGWDWISFNRHLLPVMAEAPSLPQTPSGPQAGVLERALGMFRLPSLLDWATITANLTRLIAWQSLALVPLLYVAAKTKGRFVWGRVLAASVLFSLLPYLFLMPDQGHGWGYRYLHGLLGNLVLLAIPGWIALGTLQTKPRFKAWVILCLAGTVLIMIPLRAFQIGAMVRPYAAATALASQQDADVVIIDSYRVWIGGDIPRNSAVSPARPVQMDLRDLSAEQITTLCKAYTVIVLDTDAIHNLGVRVSADPFGPFPDDFDAIEAALAECGS